MSIWTSPSGRTLVDFGQNLVGWIRLRAHGEPGAVITVRHAEVLEHDELGIRPLRNAKATDRFVLSGRDDVFEPTLTFHGFRYAEVDGFPGELTADDLEAVVVHTDLERTGTFECSDAEVNQLHSNVVWGLKGNLLDVPTDCPQRDERLGWTGDLAVVAPTAAYLFDVAAFMDDWMADLAAEQTAADGRVPFVVPDVLKYDGFPEEFQPIESAADLVRRRGVGALGAVGGVRRSPTRWPGTCRRWSRTCGTSRVCSRPRGLWDTHDPVRRLARPGRAAGEPGRGQGGPRSRRHSVVLPLGGDDGATPPASSATTRSRPRPVRSRAACGRRSRSTTSATAGACESDCQTVYALAIWFGLLDGDQKDVAGDRLAELVEEAGHRISTGFAGTPYVLDALTATGHTDVAYAMLLQREVPGWMYQVRWARPRCGSAGTRCCPTARSTRAR